MPPWLARVLLFHPELYVGLSLFLDLCPVSDVKAHGDGQQAIREAFEMRRALWWAGMWLRLLIVGVVALVAIFDWRWFSGYVARQASGALGRTVVVERNLDVDSTWPPSIQAEQVRLAVLDWSWIKDYVVRKASEALGRTVVVEGNLDVDFT